MSVKAIQTRKLVEIKYNDKGWLQNITFVFSDGTEAPPIGSYPSKTTRGKTFDCKIGGVEICLGVNNDHR